LLSFSLSFDGRTDAERSAELTIGQTLEPNRPAQGLRDGSRWSSSHARSRQETNEFVLAGAYLGIGIISWCILGTWLYAMQ